MDCIGPGSGYDNIGYDVEYFYLVYRTKNVEKGGEQARKSRRWLDVSGY